jgi:hypothetical protein
VLKLGGSLRSFERIQAFHLPEELGCFGAKLPDLVPLAALSGLRRLDLRTSEKWKDFTPLADLTGIQGRGPLVNLPGFDRRCGRGQ